MTESLMIKQLKNHEESAFEYCYYEYSQMVFHVIMTIVKNQDAAQDIMQDVFIKMYYSIDQFDGRFFKAWLIKIAKNESFNYLRVLNNTVEFNDHKHNNNPSNNQEQLLLLMELEELLDPLEYQIVVMRNVYKMRNSEIAYVLKSPESTISGLYRRACQKYKKQYGGKYG